ncbi:hypothetical protein RCH18_002901 [Flavobacterium sp. PL11]|uniref:photosystem reaction center subunit H n=1 Tax=Flavobacterium sp. PL11 TaxID=3071717 RepID=UPI002DFE71B8|nr:hypothetical protein [Flavobacterium sp. PL11]
MKDENKNLYYLHELSDYKVADNYSDVRDWKVLDSDYKVIGKVDGLLVSKEAERVVYLDVEVDEALIEQGHQTFGKPTTDGVHEFLNDKGDTHLIIPIGLVTLDEDSSKVHCNSINYSTFVKTKRFKKGMELDRSYELMVLPHYEIAVVADESNVATENDFSNEQRIPNDSFYNRKEFFPPIKD